MELLQIKMLNTAVERLLNQEISELGMTYTQSTVIGYLLENRDKDICQRDIEYSLGLSHATVSSILRRMELKDMVDITISPSDHRYKKITLTEKAVSRSDEIGATYRRVKQILFSGVTAEQRELFNATIRRLLENIEQQTN